MRKISRQSNFLYITDRSEAATCSTVASILTGLAVPLFIHFLFKLNEPDSKAELIVTGICFLICAGLAFYYFNKRAEILKSSDEEAAVFIFDGAKKLFIDAKSGKTLATFKECRLKETTKIMVRGGSYRVLLLKRPYDEIELVDNQQIAEAVKHLSALGIKNV